MRSNPTSTTQPASVSGKGQPSTPGSAAPTPPRTGSPSVPISVYRELAAELQATKAMLESINTQNQQLTRQNQTMRQEIERLVQSALTLQQIAGLAQPAYRAEASPQPPTETVADLLRSQASRSKSNVNPTESSPSESGTVTNGGASLSDDLFTEQGAPPHRMNSRPTPKDAGTLWLLLTIIVIILTAFGAGFLVFRAFLPRR